MTRKDYIKIADTLRTVNKCLDCEVTEAQLKHIIEHFELMLLSDNERFSCDRFEAYINK